MKNPRALIVALIVAVIASIAQWQYVANLAQRGSYTVLARATDSQGRRQPEAAAWNVLGYGNNGVREHGVTFKIT